MKTSKRNKLLCLALAGGFSLFGATNALAAAGATISNRATLNYDVGGTTQTLIESGAGAGNSTPGATNGNDTDFIEDRIINFNVTREAGAVQVIPGGTQQAIPYIIENVGNGTHGFLLAGVHNSGALDPNGSGVSDDLTPTTIETWVDVDGDGLFNPIADNVNFVAQLPSGPAGGTIGVDPQLVRVFVVSDIPLLDDASNPLVNGDIAVMSLVAQAAGAPTADPLVEVSTGIAADAYNADDNGNTSPAGTFTNGAASVTAGVSTPIGDVPGTMQTVFNDTAATDAVTGPTIDADSPTGADTDKNAVQSGYGSYTIQTAALTVAKTSSALWDPLNFDSNPKSIPGGYVRYAISVANAAAAANADLTILSDVLPASLDLDPDFITGVGVTPPPTSVAGDAIQVVKGATTIYCTGDVGDSDGDGCSYGPVGAGGTVSVDFSNATFGTIMPLAATETVTINFNTIVQ